MNKILDFKKYFSVAINLFKYSFNVDFLILYLKWNFLLSYNREQEVAFKLTYWISQWLMRTPNYNIERLIQFIISLEEFLLIEDDKFDNLQKQLILQYAKQFIEINEDLLCDTMDDTHCLIIFTKDKKFKEVSLIILDFLEKDYYLETELIELKNIRKKYFGVYNWKTTHMERENEK
jgi:hypothetical protein